VILIVQLVAMRAGGTLRFMGRRHHGRIRPGYPGPIGMEPQDAASCSGFRTSAGTGTPRPVFDHVTIRVADLEAAAGFYDTVLPTVGIERTATTADGVAWGEFRIARATAEHPATERLHIGFGAPSRDHVDAFWTAGTAAGHPDDGAPGPRPQYTPDYYGGFLRDPDGNSAEAVHGTGAERPGVIDHLWIRVAEVAAAREFYLAALPGTGFEPAGDEPDHALFRAAACSFSLVPGEPSRNVHLGFGPGDVRRDPDGNTVEGVHRA
jgi:catechol 2,3-dioxygenase-like lactoylglutathione lyase family enzyme